MKKLILMICVCLLGVCAPAQSVQKYTAAEITAKISKLQTLEWDRIPYPFVYTEKLEWTDNQSDINLFYAAKRMYEKHPGNFAAAYNYATLIMSEDYGEGLAIGDTQTDEAYRILEQAKKLRPDFKPLYEQQIYLLNFKLFGPSWVGPGIDEEEAVAVYRQNPDLARKQLALYQTIAQKWGPQLSAAAYYDCYHICLSLNRTQQAAFYKTQIEEAQRREAEAEASVRKSVKENQKKQLIRSLYQASFSARY